jgi:pimeloyl-ACP methyl ester carboxylesterase
VQNIPEPVSITVEGCPIELYLWGRVGSPGLLFLHGNRGHAGWWNFLAPYFADTHRVASLSWSGMGGSGWRSHYSMELHMREALAAAESAGLFVNTQCRPVVVAHSFGGRPAALCARDCGDWLVGCIVVDSSLVELRVGKVRTERRVYTSEAEALARFRFAPSQLSRNPFITDFLARRGLIQLHPQGWTWRFDPAHAEQMVALPDQMGDLRNAACRLAFIYGAESSLTSERVQDAHRRASPPGSIYVSIAEAAHHVMVDQPLVLLNELRSIIHRWHSLEVRRYAP